MQIFKKTINKAPSYDFDNNYRKEDILFFDIETTGFSAATTVLYLIGCVYYNDNNWKTIQWFADNNTSELNMLHSFFEFLEDFKVLVHYNGDGFDIPYILKKCNQYHLNYHFNNIISIDIYRRVLPYKKIIKIENLKQKTVERFLDIYREDQYSGGELIQIYGNYLRCINQNDLRQDDFLLLLLLHNEEDILGLLEVSRILNYSDLFKKELTVIDAILNENQLVLSISISALLPKRISYGNDTLYFSAFGNNATLKIQLYKDELKFFYDNYKDYYYLPNEDTALHKSVAFYVDKHFRTKAKAATCYSKKTGIFIPQYDDIITPYFKIDYYDKVKYIEATNDLLNDSIKLNQYAKHILESL